MVASPSDNRPRKRPAKAESVNASAVAVVVATTKGRLFSSSNGVFARIRKNNAGKETYSRKKFIQASPASGRALNLPQAKPTKISPKYGSAKFKISIIRIRGRMLGACALLSLEQASGG